jgi:hypothetical protein
MAPSHATATGVTPQVLDDPRLVKLLADLSALTTTSFSEKSNGNSNSDAALDHLVTLLGPWQNWVFEEQVRYTPREYHVYDSVQKRKRNSCEPALDSSGCSLKKP